MSDHFPSWTATLDSMIETKRDGFRVAVSCDTCRGWRDLDQRALETLRAKKGGGYSLVNRRCRCRLKADCPGWNRFHFQSAVMRPLWDDRTLARWMGSAYLPNRKRRR